MFACHSSAHFFLSPGIFLLGVPVIFSPFSTVLIFASLYQNKEEREKLQDKGGPASPQVSSLIHKKRHRQLFLQYLPHPRIIVNNPVFPTKEIKLTRKRGLFILARMSETFFSDRSTSKATTQKILGLMGAPFGGRPFIQVFFAGFVCWFGRTIFAALFCFL